MNRILSESAKKKRKPVARKSTRTSGSSACRDYKIAVLNPFSERSKGVRALDGFTFPTQTRNLKGKFTLGTNGGTSSTMAVALLPSPVVSVLDAINFVTSGLSTSMSVQGSLTNFASNSSVYGGTSNTGMANQFETFRVVAAGMKVRVVMPELTRTGMITFAPFLCNPNTPGFNALTNLAITNPNMWSSLSGGILPSVVSSAALLELPGAFEMSIPELGRQDIVLPFKPISPDAFRFHGTDTTASYGATTVYGTEIVSNSTGNGILGTADFQDIAAMAGFMGWLVYVDGVPSATPNILNIEYVYHMEGVPSINAAAVAQPVPDAVPTPNVSASDWMQTVRDIAYSPMFTVVTQGLDAMGVGSSGGHRNRRLLN